MDQLEYRELDVLPGKIEVKQGKFIKFISRRRVIL